MCLRTPRGSRRNKSSSRKSQVVGNRWTTHSVSTSVTEWGYVLGLLDSPQLVVLLSTIRFLCSQRKKKTRDSFSCTTCLHIVVYIVCLCVCTMLADAALYYFITNHLNCMRNGRFQNYLQSAARGMKGSHRTDCNALMVGQLLEWLQLLHEKFTSL